MKVVVIGAGLAGLTAAITLAEAGAGVTLVTKGLGGLSLSQGTIDVWGRDPVTGGLVDDSLRAIAEAPEGHPYRCVGIDAVAGGLGALRRWLPGWFEGDLHRNRVVPTAAGAWRPTCLVPAGYRVDPAAGQRWAIVGLPRLKDFQPALIARNLARTPLPDGGFVSARAVSVDMPARAHEVDASPITYARAFDDPAFQARFAAAVGDIVEANEIVALPAVLGLSAPEAFADLRELIGHPMIEVVMPPPCVPGVRLDQALRAYAQRVGVRFVLGATVTGFSAEGARVVSVTADTAGHPTAFAADEFVLAAGGFESGGLVVDASGSVAETIFGLPVTVPEGSLFTGDYWGVQPLFSAGLRTDASLRPMSPADVVPYENLRAVGGALGGAVRWRELSGEGVALATAWAAARAIEGALP